MSAPGPEEFMREAIRLSREAEVRLGVLAGSLLSAVVGYLVLLWRTP